MVGKKIHAPGSVAATSRRRRRSDEVSEERASVGETDNDHASDDNRADTEGTAVWQRCVDKGRRSSPFRCKERRLRRGTVTAARGRATGVMRVRVSRREQALGRAAKARGVSVAMVVMATVGSSGL